MSFLPGSSPSRVLSVARLLVDDFVSEPKKAKLEAPLALSFFDEDKVGTIQPHDDTLVVTLRIGGYDVRRIMVDQGSGAEIMSRFVQGAELKAQGLNSL